MQDTPIILIALFVFLFGAVIGSFLNVVIYRLPREESVVFPSSHCPNCAAPIRFYDNVPILSWLILGGRCRGCQDSISFRYPLVELITGLLFLITFLAGNFDARLPFDLAFVAALIALIFIDAEHMILPNAINYPGLVVALVARAALPFAMGEAAFDDLSSPPFDAVDTTPLWFKSLLGAGLGALVGGGSLWLVGWIWKQLRGVDAMGLGDVKMMLMVGAFLGWRLTLLTIFLAALTGALGGSLLIIGKKDRSLQTQIPFGIFLGLGAIISLLFGKMILAWYLGTFV